MEPVIRGNTSATRSVPGALPRLAGYRRARLRWFLAGLAGAALCIFCTGLWGWLLHHALVLLLPLPVLLAWWLVIGAEQARQMQRPMPTCRRQ